MFDLSCVFHGPSCSDPFHIAFFCICLVLGLSFFSLLIFGIACLVDCLRVDHSRVETMFDGFYWRKVELMKLRQDLEELKRTSVTVKVIEDPEGGDADA